MPALARVPSACRPALSSRAAGASANRWDLLCAEERRRGPLRLQRCWRPLPLMGLLCRWGLFSFSPESRMTVEARLQPERPDAEVDKEVIGFAAEGCPSSAGELCRKTHTYTTDTGMCCRGLLSLCPRSRLTVEARLQSDKTETEEGRAVNSRLATGSSFACCPRAEWIWRQGCSHTAGTELLAASRAAATTPKQSPARKQGWSHTTKN